MTTYGLSEKPAGGLTANIGPVTLHLTAEGLELLSAEWQKRGRETPLDDVVNGLISDYARLVNDLGGRA